MTLQHVPFCPTPIEWLDAFTGPFEIFNSLAKLLEHTGAISHWAMVLKNGQGIYVEEGHVKKVSQTSIKSLEWFELPQAGYMGVPLYVDSNFIHDALPVINALFPIHPSVAPQNKLEDIADLVDQLPFLISILDTELRYQFVNETYEATYQLSRDEVIGKHVTEVAGPEQFEKVKGALARALAGEQVDAHFPAVFKGRNGIFNQQYIACSFIPKRKHGIVEGVYVCVRDQTPLKRITTALQKFHDITSNSHISLHDKINRVLSLGCEILNLPMGVVSNIEGDRYEVLYCHCEENAFKPGDVFDLNTCYCYHTLKRGQVTGYYHAGASDISTHPCYLMHKIESYLGVAIYQNDKVFGTINFFGHEIRSADFNEDEYELVKLFGQWLESELTKQANKKAILEAEQHYRLIIESVRDGIVGADHDGNIIFVNKAAASLVAYEPHDLIGKSVTCLLRSERNNEAEQSHYENLLLHAVCRQYKIASTDAKFARADGSWFPVQFSCTPLVEGQENGLSCVITFQDITDQKETENALQEQMEMFKSLFMDAPEAIVVVDEHRLIRMVNPIALQMFGYSESQLIGKSPRFLYADTDSYDQVGLAFLQEKHPEREEYRMVYRCADGSEIITDNVRSKITNENGELGGFIIHARDISSRLEIEANIAKTQRRLSIATESARIGVWEMDLQTQELVWDQRMFELYQMDYVSDSLDYSVWSSFVHPDDKERVLATVASAIRLQTDLDVDFRIVLRNGVERHIKACARTALDTDGNSLYLFGTNTDISERYETEQVLKHAREEAIKASQAKSNFLATMSHEIRTPLNGVLGMTEILSNSDLTKEQRNQLKIIQSSGESLLELINEILDFSKIEAGHLSLEIIDFDLEGLVYDLSRLLVHKAESKKVDLLVEYGLSEFSAVQGDAYRIRQILLNLVGNAIKFTEVGQVIIRVTGAVSKTGNNLDITISVIDSGVGISEEAQRRLFQVFMQADNSTTRKFGGTGLGLAITKQLVDLMGGEISLESTVGKGSAFHVSLSLGIAEKPSKRLLAGPQQAEFSKVLVVDDNATNLAILQNQLELCQLKAEFFQSPHQAFASVIDAAKQNDPYDLLILDYLMPDLDGLAFSKGVHDLVAESLLPKVLLISSAGALSSRELKDSGVSKCINKPASVHELKRGIDSLRGLEASCHYVASDAKTDEQSEFNSKQLHLNAAKILVVEDMKANLAVVKGMLSHYDVQVEVAENGLAAIEKWQQFKPDLILMDLHMPIMDGITAIKQIRSLEQSGERIPIIALTADVQPERIEEVKRIGGDGYLSKPFKGAELVRTISAWLTCGEKKEANGSDVMNSLEREESNILEDALDESVLKSLEEILGDQVQEIVVAFLQDADGVMSALDAADASNDIDAMYRPAHSLKSVSANVGAMALSAKAAELESEAKAGVVDQPHVKIEAIKEEFARVKTHLKRIGRLP